MSHITPFGWYWLVWGFLGFGLPEAYGIAYNAKDTLSWQVWGLEHVNLGHPFDFADWTPLHYLLGVMLLVFVIWLGGHMILGIWH